MTRTILSTIALCACTLLSTAQTTYDIEAGGGPNGPDPYYAPQFISIEVGDIVRWTNSGGTHNVDGSADTYPDNPEGFANGAASSSLWVFEHTFTIPGVYGFECSAFNHAETQFGTITVGAVGLDEEIAISLELYPNPVVDVVSIQAADPISQLRLFDLEGRVVLEKVCSELESTVLLSVADIARGSYMIEVITRLGKATRQLVVES